MPIVELKIVGKLTKKQKRELAKRFTDALEEVAGKPPEYTYVLIHEVSDENWAHRGKLFADAE
jgi:4-oxalocrotonate tautomerase family enzyme